MGVSPPLPQTNTMASCHPPPNKKPNFFFKKRIWLNRGGTPQGSTEAAPMSGGTTAPRVRRKSFDFFLAFLESPPPPFFKKGPFFHARLTPKKCFYAPYAIKNKATYELRCPPAPLSPIENRPPRWLGTSNVPFPSEDSNQCIHPEVPFGTRTQPFWQPHPNPQHPPPQARAPSSAVAFGGQSGGQQGLGTAARGPGGGGGSVAATPRGPAALERPFLTVSQGSPRSSGSSTGTSPNWRSTT